MYTGLLHTHKLVVILFLLIYLIKTFLLLSNKLPALATFTKKLKVPEMIVSTFFLVTGIGMLVLNPLLSTLQIIKLFSVFASIPLAIIGFKKQNKALAVLSLLLIIAAYGLAEVNKAKQKQTPNIDVTSITESSSPQEQGNAVYKAANCNACHGEKGDLGKNGAADLSSTSLSKEELAGIIKNGKNTMPAYKTLSNEDIDAVVTYIETLKQ